MPTKNELEKELEELKAHFAELEAAGAATMRVRAVDGTFEAPEEGGLYRYDGSGDLVAVEDDADEVNDLIVTLTRDVSRLEIERNDARNEVARLKVKLRDTGTLHGHIDSLPTPY